MSTQVKVFDQSDTTDAFGQCYATFPAHIDFILATLNAVDNGGHSAGHLQGAWVSGDKQATVKVVKPDGTPLTSKTVNFTVGGWSA